MDNYVKVSKDVGRITVYDVEGFGEMTFDREEYETRREWEDAAEAYAKVIAEQYGCDWGTNY